jgi:hypothetical protein
MSNVVNWKKVAGLAAALIFAEILVGFIQGFADAGTNLDAAKRTLVQSTLLSLTFSTLIFSAMSARQDHRPFLHATLVLLLAFVFSVALGAVLPARLTDTPLILAVLEWLTLVVGLIIGTTVGHYLRLRRVRADA